jgi:hypothetical protein
VLAGKLPRREQKKQEVCALSTKYYFAWKRNFSTGLAGL